MQLQCHNRWTHVCQSRHQQYFHQVMIAKFSDVQISCPILWSFLVHRAWDVFLKPRDSTRTSVSATDVTFKNFTYFAIDKKVLSKRFQGMFQHFQVWFNANGISIVMQMTVPFSSSVVFSVIFHTFSMTLPSASGKTTTFLIKVQEPVKVSKVTSVHQ